MNFVENYENLAKACYDAAKLLKISPKRSGRLKRQRTGPIGRKLILSARERRDEL